MHGVLIKCHWMHVSSSDSLPFICHPNLIPFAALGLSFVSRGTIFLRLLHCRYVLWIISILKNSLKNISSLCVYFHFRTCLREKEDTRKIIVNKIKNFEMPSKANMCADRPPVYFKLYSKKWLEIGLDPTPQSGGKNYRSAYSKWDKISKIYSMRN